MTFRDTNPLGSLFLESTSAFADRIAVRVPEGDFTYAALRQLATALAAKLAAAGVGRQSKVGLSVKKDPVQSMVAVVALSLLGSPWVPYGPYLRGHKAIVLTHLLHDSDSVDAQPGAIPVSSVWPDATSLPNVSSQENFPGYACADDPWYLADSSGTTGSVKSMAITGRAYFERICRLRTALTDDPGFSAATLFGHGSNMACLYFYHSLHRGGTCIFSRDYDYLVRQDTRLVVGSPAQLARFLDNREAPANPVLHEVRVGGATVPPPFVARLRQHFSTVQIIYGSTECGPVTMRPVAGDHGDKSVGRAFRDVALEIVDADGRAVPAGTEGLVRVKTASQATGYLGDPAATAAAFRDGWFYPGDRGYLSVTGDLYVTGRDQDHLNISGSNINATVVDEVMQGVDGVSDALCFLELNPSGVYELAAMVVVEPGADSKQVVKAIVRALLAAGSAVSLLPRNFYQVSAVPRNENGKPTRHGAAPLVAGMKPIAQVGRQGSAAGTAG